MKLNTPTSTVLYSIEETTKAYRKLCTKNILKSSLDITIDQGLILIILDKEEKISQSELGELVFKDYASITRILNLMEKKDFIKKTISSNDRRRSVIEITQKGKKTLTILNPIIQLNRNTALKGLSNKEMIHLYGLLKRIADNCNQELFQIKIKKI